MWAKLHVPNICSGHKNIMVKFTQAVAVTEIIDLKKCHLSNCYIHNYKEKHLIPSSTLSSTTSQPLILIPLHHHIYYS